MPLWSSPASDSSAAGTVCVVSVVAVEFVKQLKKDHRYMRDVY
jgi:hypothetical protein